MELVRSACDLADQAPRIAGVLAGHIPERVRRLTLWVVLPESPFYVDQLSPERRARYRTFQPVMAQEMEQRGFSTLVCGMDFTADDYIDRVHLSPQGGVKLTQSVAPRIRALAKKLGYQP